jgi:kinesin family protein 5
MEGDKKSRRTSLTPTVGVRVCARFRPENAVEKEMSSKDCVEYLSDTSVKLCGGDECGEHKFNFDRIFSPDCTQENVFEYAALPTIQDVLEGYNGTIFAYGQTGSGKTHTMEGPSHEDPEQCGVIPRMIFSVFDGIAKGDPDVE